MTSSSNISLYKSFIHTSKNCDKSFWIFIHFISSELEIVVNEFHFLFFFCWCCWPHEKTAVQKTARKNSLLVGVVFVIWTELLVSRNIFVKRDITKELSIDNVPLSFFSTFQPPQNDSIYEQIPNRQWKNFQIKSEFAACETEKR